MSGEILKAFAIVGLMGVMGFVIHLFIRRSQALLHGWAKEHGYEILDAEPRFFRRGPYGWSSKNQVVYRVWVRDREGVERLGWVRCGSYWGGVFDDKVESQTERV